MSAKSERREHLAEVWRGAQVDGKLSNEYVRRQAAANDYSSRQVRRIVAGQGLAPARGQWRLTDRALELYCVHKGCVSRVARDLRAEDSSAPGERQLQRCFRSQLGSDERAFVAKGYVARREHSGCIRWEARHRNSMWQTDDTALKIPVLLSGREIPVRMHLTYFLCCSTRMVMGWMVSPTGTEDATLEALRDAILIDEESGKLHGGVPDVVVSDNGLNYLAKAVEEGCTMLGIERVVTEGYSPNQNGKIERCHQTITREALRDLPSWERGPRDRTDQPYDTTPIDETELIERLETAIRFYNYERPHQALGGQTPWEAFSADPHALRHATPESLRFALRTRKEQTVQPSGVYKHRRYYRSDELDTRIGEKVIVAWLKRDQRFVDVYTLAGEFLCTAEPNVFRLDDEEVTRITAKSRKRKTQQTRRLNGTYAKLNEQRAPINKPDQSAVVTVLDAAAGDPDRPTVPADVLAQFGIEDTKVERWEF